MKILVISAHFPPYHLGGYELRCKDVFDQLNSRGYQVSVLTSIREGATVETAPYPVARSLVLRVRGPNFIDQLTRSRITHYLGLILTLFREIRLDNRDIAAIEEEIAEFQPDVIYLGHVINFTKSLMPFFASLEIPIVYDEGGIGLLDTWKNWGIWYKFVEEFSPTTGILKSIKQQFVHRVSKSTGGRLKTAWKWPEQMQIIYNSRLNLQNAQETGVPVEFARVIHSGLDLEKFTWRGMKAFSNPLAIILPGRIEPRKGQLDAVRLVDGLRKKGIDAKLTLLGTVSDQEYDKEVESLIEEYGMQEIVERFEMVSHEDLAALYQQSDICFFPSYHRTGFSRIPLEGMACGSVVISYGNEGSDEVIQDTKNGFLVETGDLEKVIEVIERLRCSPEEIASVVEQARRNVEEKFAIPIYANSIEKILLQVVEGSGVG